MTTTVHEEAAGSLLAKILDDPRGGPALNACRADLDKWPPDYVQVIGQHHWERYRWPLEQVAAFSVVHSEIMSGDVARVVIGTRRNTPHADEDRAANAAGLSDLPHPFTAGVDLGQGNADQDGWLEWSEPIDVEVSTGVPLIGADGSMSPVIMKRTLLPGGAPLEIGYTMPSATLLHLRRNRSVARWPYGHPFLTLLVSVGEHWQRKAGL